ncbi:tyrosine-type recombinase/integrase [Flavobacterium orientale]|uniref:Integrase n=1 Tax=Flavobacterium orientale TaxID=1756020 RepID=A0A917D9Q9_9FLAO|nr:tyrosine-type recombinase/integrase [Flavobacterium orientale]GGD14662.1 integrase [Flavobacterium orientale]
MESNVKAFIDYLQYQKKYSPHTVLAYQRDILEFSTFVNQTYDQDTITLVVYPQIRSWIVFLSDQEISNRTINRKISSLKAYYRFLLRIKAISSSPLLKHTALKTPKTLQIPFSEKEINLVLNQLVYPDGFEGIRDKLIIDLFYTTGIRRAELINLKLTSIDFATNTIKVLGKRNKERILPLLPIIIQQLQSYMKERESFGNMGGSDYLFLTQKGVKLNDSFVYRLINSYFSGVSEKVKKSPHILRHTFATHMLNHGANLNSVKELLGHSSLASTQVYTHSSLSELKKVYQDAHPRNN